MSEAEDLRVILHALLAQMAPDGITITAKALREAPRDLVISTSLDGSLTFHLAPEEP